ncbi:hypothetical protein J6590_020859 [Homalodisca vitripennis]|nr:hypothetical protein J6590_020859 [Homalodisca vitripennis]
MKWKNLYPSGSALIKRGYEDNNCDKYRSLVPSVLLKRGRELLNERNRRTEVVTTSRSPGGDSMRRCFRFAPNKRMNVLFTARAVKDSGIKTLNALDERKDVLNISELENMEKRKLSYSHESEQYGADGDAVAFNGILYQLPFGCETPPVEVLTANANHYTVGVKRRFGHNIRESRWLVPFRVAAAVLAFPLILCTHFSRATAL